MAHAWGRRQTARADEGALRATESTVAGKLLCMGQYRGRVKWFNNAKGFGFLGRENGADVFVHYGSIEQEGYKGLREDEEVEFDIVQGEKGPQADRVVRLHRVVRSEGGDDPA